MTGAFIDTTVLIHLSEPQNAGAAKAASLVDKYRPSQVPYYALHELLSGRVRILCDVHNALLSSTNPGEAMTNLLQRSPAEGRKREARLQEIGRLLTEVFSRDPTGSRGTLNREAQEAVALKAARLWLGARRHRSLDSVQPLACFVDGDLTFGDAGELRGPGTFNCASKERCAAAAYLYDDQAALTKLIAALHPNNLGESAASKQENKSRRAALKDLLANGPKKFSKVKCRALGDAYFAMMAPPSFAVATSNTVDFKPLCDALNKPVVQP